MEYNENTGLTKSLNEALTFSRGNLIDQIDAYDNLLPIRLEKQVKNFIKDS